MDTIRLGKTDLIVTRTAFGVLPLQRVEMVEAVRILRRAYDAGINFYDTARGYTDSEEKIGAAFSGQRDKVIIATKSGAGTKSKLLSDLETSLRMLKTDYVDLLQLHNPSRLPDSEDAESSYAGLIDAKQKGMVRHIGITSHSLERARVAVDSGLYETLQYPLCHISSEDDLAVIDKCREAGMGVIAMKPFSGGLITNARAAFAFFRQYDNVVPIWGFQQMGELDEILSLDGDPPAMNPEIWAAIARDRADLAGEFCRACGYCLPCPADIPITMAARISLCMRRMPYEQFLTEEWREKMHRIEDCQSCGHCTANCPYGLDTPSLLKRMLVEYEEFYAGHVRT